MSHHIVSLRNVALQRRARQIFDNVSLDIPEGKITAIMGPSGAGKTSILRLIGGQVLPNQGSVSVFGEDLARLSLPRLYQLRERMGMLYQQAALFTHLSVFDNVAFPLREHTDLTERMIHDLVMIKLETVGLRGAYRLMPSQLSGGMAKRVGLARATALDPEIMLYDEPFSGQDPITCGVLKELITTINQNLHTTSVIVSHNVSRMLEIADYIYIIANGGVIGQGTPQALTAESSPLVQQFIQGLPDGSVPFHYPAEEIRHSLFANTKKSKPRELVTV
jgi:phospholipid/cholesterol/gamma-HCH transport system ATP-binding protein